MKVEGSIALFTGAHRGLGAAFCPRSSSEARPRSTPEHATPGHPTTRVPSPCNSTSRQRQTSPRPLSVVAT